MNTCMDIYMQHMREGDIREEEEEQERRRNRMHGIGKQKRNLFWGKEHQQTKKSVCGGEVGSVCMKMTMVFITLYVKKIS